MLCHMCPPPSCRPLSCCLVLLLTGCPPTTPILHNSCCRRGPPCPLLPPPPPPHTHHALHERYDTRWPCHPINPCVYTHTVPHTNAPSLVLYTPPHTHTHSRRDTVLFCHALARDVAPLAVSVSSITVVSPRQQCLSPRTTEAPTNCGRRSSPNQVNPFHFAAHSCLICCPATSLSAFCTRHRYMPR